LEWLTQVMSGLSALLSLIAVIIVSRLDSHSERRRWKRDEQMQAAIELKLAVSRLRATHSHPGDGTVAGDLADGRFDFSDVNAAMTRVDLVGSGAAIDAVKALREQLRDFVRASNAKDPDWLARRMAVDGTLDRIVSLVRKEVS
jgi:hypothetical protein